MAFTPQWRSAAATDPGKVRGRNEDAVLDCPERGLWAVADGMGGHRAGDIASQWVVASLAELTQPQSFDERLKSVRRCFQRFQPTQGF